MRKNHIFFINIVLFLFFIECVHADKALYRMITDCSGAQIKMPIDINKVVVTSPSAAAFMTAMNLNDKIVGAHGSILNHSWAPIFYEGFNNMARFGKNPNAEELIAFGADLAIIQDAAYAEALRKSGVNAVCFSYTNKDELYFALNMLGEIFGDNAKSYIVAWKDKLESIISKISADLSNIPDEKKYNVYYINATGAKAANQTLYLTAGSGSFVEFWVNTSGANLATSKYNGIEHIDQESALRLNPDTIFICGWLEYMVKDILMNDPLWQNVSAVKNDRLFLMPTSLVPYDRFSVELPLMLDYTASILYPKQHVFKGIEALREFYKNYYGRSFSDEQLNNMFKGLNPDGTRMGE